MGIAKKLSDESIIAQLYRGEELAELIQSIAANGYLDIEPLIVMLDNHSATLTVLEGNRRFAAIRLFREPELVEKISKEERLRINVPEISSIYRSTLDQVSFTEWQDVRGRVPSLASSTSTAQPNGTPTRKQNSRPSGWKGQRHSGTNFGKNR